MTTIADYTYEDSALGAQVDALNKEGRHAWTVSDCGHRTDEDDDHTGFVLSLGLDKWERDGDYLRNRCEHTPTEEDGRCWYASPDTRRNRETVKQQLISDAMERNDELLEAMYDETDTVSVAKE